MQFIFSSRKCAIRENTKAYAQKKLEKLDKFFSGGAVVHVIFTLEKENLCKVEVTVDYRGLIFRAQESSSDFNESIDKIVDVLVRQIRKHKTRLEKRLRDSSFVFDNGDKDNVVEEKEYEIIRRKNILIKPMSIDEAILQMNLLGHDFFVFKEDDLSSLKVVYRRKDGNYGLIETE